MERTASLHSLPCLAPSLRVLTFGRNLAACPDFTISGLVLSGGRQLVAIPAARINLFRTRPSSSELSRELQATATPNQRSRYQLRVSRQVLFTGAMSRDLLREVRYSATSNNKSLV